MPYILFQDVLYGNSRLTFLVFLWSLVQLINDILIEEALKAITENVSYFKKQVTTHFEKAKKDSRLALQMEYIEELIQENKQKEKAITSSSIIESAKKEMVPNLKMRLISLILNQWN